MRTNLSCCLGPGLDRPLNFDGCTPARYKISPGLRPGKILTNIGRGRGSPGEGLSSAGFALIKVKISKLRRDLVFLSPDIAFKSSKVPGDPRSKQNFHRGCAPAKVLKGVLFAGWPPARPSAVPGPEGHPRGIGRGCPALSGPH